MRTFLFFAAYCIVMILTGFLLQVGFNLGA